MLALAQGFQCFSLRYAARKILEHFGDFAATCQFEKLIEVKDWIRIDPVKTHKGTYGTLD